MRGHAGEEFVVGIGVGFHSSGTSWKTRSTIRLRQHDHAVHRLDAPAGVDEALREPVEQFGMARRAALLAEVARCAHEAATKMVLPDAVHHHAGSERIARVDDGLREFQSAAAFREWLLRPKSAQELAWHLIAFGERIAAREHTRRAGQRTIDQNRRVSRCGAVFDDEAVHLALRLPQLGDDAAREIHLNVRDVLIRHKGGRVEALEHFLGQFDARMLFHPGLPAMHDEGVEVFLVNDLVESLVRDIFPVRSRPCGSRRLAHACAPSAPRGVSSSDRGSFSPARSVRRFRHRAHGTRASALLWKTP
jgi:hypothetical protein